MLKLKNLLLLLSFIALLSVGTKVARADSYNDYGWCYLTNGSGWEMLTKYWCIVNGGTWCPSGNSSDCEW